MLQIPLRDALRQLRDALDLTQEQMARRMGTTVRTIARWESGPVNSLPLEMLIYLRHVAVQGNQEELADYFDGLLQAIYASDDATELAASVHRFLPGNLREMQLIGELLERIRKSDSAIEPVITQLDELRKQRIDEEERKILELHTKRGDMRQALKDLELEHKHAIEQRVATEHGSLAKARLKEPSGAQLELAARTAPNSQAAWDVWWPRLTPNLRAIISHEYSPDELERVKRLGAKKLVQPSTADTVRDLLARRPQKKREKS